MSEKKIGIMGGTFNPIHYGHLILAENALTQYHLDKIYFLPAGVPPHKRNQNITDGHIRYEMVVRSIADNPAFEALDIEVVSKQPSYTYRTLEHLTEIFPDTELSFIMGADSLADFKFWREPERISELCSLLVATRDELAQAELEQLASQLRSEFRTRIDYLNTPNILISSHEIRERVKNQESIRYLVPETVRTYIAENHLYRESE